MSEEDYSPVASTDEEEEQRRRLAAAYPAPVSAAAPAVTSAPLGSTEDLEARSAQPRAFPVAEAPAPALAPTTPRPEWKDYAPAEPHGMAKFGHFMASLYRPTNDFFNRRPEKNAEQAYEAA